MLAVETDDDGGDGDGDQGCGDEFAAAAISRRRKRTNKNKTVCCPFGRAVGRQRRHRDRLSRTKRLVGGGGVVEDRGAVLVGG